MKTPRAFLVSLTLALSLPLSASAAPESGAVVHRRVAQAVPQGDSGDSGGDSDATGTGTDSDKDDRQARRQKIMQRVRALRAWKLTEALELDEATAAKLFPILSRYDIKFTQVMRETRALHLRIRALTDANDPTSRADIERMLDLLVANQRKLWDLQEARFGEVRKVLTPAQAATIFVVLPEIDRRIHKQVKRALRGGGKSGQGPRGPRRQRSAD